MSLRPLTSRTRMKGHERVTGRRPGGGGVGGDDNDDDDDSGGDDDDDVRIKKLMEMTIKILSENNKNNTLVRKPLEV